MKRTLLLMMTLVLAALGAKAALPPAIEWNYTYNGTPYSGKYDIDDGQQKLKIETNQSGALAAFIAATKDSESVLYGFFDNINYQKLELGKHDVALNTADFNALNSTEVPALANFETINLKEAKIEDISNMSGMSMSNLEFLLLPENLSDVSKMAQLGTNNSKLRAVLSVKKDSPQISRVSVYSFVANSMPDALNAFDGPFKNEFQKAKYVTMAGEYGERDLVDNSFNGKLYNNDPAVWDFTGAHFIDCTVDMGTGTGTYYNYNDPFQEREEDKVGAQGSYNTNAFYYFYSYAPTVVDIKLPDKNMSALPPLCLSQLASANKANYQLIYNKNDEEFNQLFGTFTSTTKYYESGTDTEFTGEKFMENDSWKGRKNVDCVSDLSVPTVSQTYQDTWADNKTFEVGDLTVNNGQVTPATFVAKLNRSAVCYFGSQQLQDWQIRDHFERRADGKLYLKEGVCNEYYCPYNISDTNTPVDEVVTWTIANNNSTFTPTDDNQPYQESGSNTWYAIIDNPGGVSFNVSTSYTYTYTDCQNNQKTLVSEQGNLTQYTSQYEVIVDLEERTVENYGQANYAPVEQLVIPNCYELLDFECGKWSHIRNLVVGNGVKRVQGGAFLKCDELENLDFVSGISDCWLGDLAFNECQSMKHIALAEGIVSLGARCFYNSQHLESIRLPESLKYMGNNSMSLCLALTSITIPRNVEKIGKSAFYRCAFTDVYLTTTDPDKIPYVFSAGTAFGQYDENCTFNHGHLDGWEGLPESYQLKAEIQQYDWDHAVEWYFLHCNGIPVLHYPQELYQKVRARISRSYHAKSTDGYGLPMQQDMAKRANVNGADLGSPGVGKYTQDGWAQFMLMKEYVPDGEDIVYSKEYNDVWYTMCFPFDLTDEQLAAAFNENFNIVDFSGVQIMDPTRDDVEKKTLVLHFNKVAVTYYKDVNEKIYKRKLDSEGNVIREQHGTYKYNVYYDPDDPTKEYHHVDANEKLVGNKTKTFALGNSLEAAAANKENAILIDGILATAGHPYMIHPAIGVNPGQPKKACDLAGITWKPQDQRGTIYDREKRTIDLGVTSTDQEKEDNYNQFGYTGYGGQEYTFKGNWKQYKDGWETDTQVGPEPTLDVALPVKRTKPTGAPVAPNFPKPSTEPVETTYNPVEDLTNYPETFQTLYNKMWDEYFTKEIDGVIERYGPQQVNYDATYGDIIYLATFSEVSGSQKMKETVNGYFGHDPNANMDETEYNSLRAKVIAFREAYQLYYDYHSVKADWDEWEAYEQAYADYTNWDQEQVDAEYNAALAAYNSAKQTYDTQHAAWAEKMVAYNMLIPKYAYFLGTKAGEIYPKYFRQMADESIPRKKGLWTQYTAIIIPNTSAIHGLEAELDGTTQNSSGSKIAFNEDFFVLDEPQGITTLIEKIEKEEGKADVKYMDIVVSIDGKIVSRDKTTFEGLPKGVYIINGKKYYVK